MMDRRDSAGVIDRRVGARIRACRERMGLTPQAFGARLGCEPELILRHESGDLRVGALLLMRLTQVCRVGVGYFLAGLTEGRDRPPSAPDQDL